MAGEPCPGSVEYPHHGCAGQPRPQHFAECEGEDAAEQCFEKRSRRPSASNTTTLRGELKSRNEAVGSGGAARRAARTGRQGEQFVQRGTVLGPLVQPFAVDQMDVVARTPGTRVAGEVPVGHDHRMLCAVNGPGGTVDRVQGGSADLGPGAGVLGLEHRTSKKRVLGYHVGGLVATSSNPPRAPAITDHQVAQRLLEGAIVYGVELIRSEGQSRPARTVATVEEREEAGRGSAGRASHWAVRQCQSRADEESTHRYPVQSRFGAGSDEVSRERSGHAVVPGAVGRLRSTVRGGLTHDFFDRSVLSQACRLPLRMVLAVTEPQGVSP